MIDLFVNGDLLTLTALIAGAFVGAIVAGMSGFAFGIVTLAIWAHAFGPSLAATLIVAGSLTVQLGTLPFMWRQVRWKTTLPFVIGGLIGVPFGVELLGHMSPDMFRLVVGVIMFVYCGTLVVSGRMPALTSPGRLADGMVGVGGGVMGGFAGLSGVPPTLWCSLMRWSKDQQRSTFQIFNLVMHTATLSTYYATDRLPEAFVSHYLLALPAIVIGAAIGFMLYRRIDDQAFKRVLLWLLTLAGAIMVATALT